MGKPGGSHVPSLADEYIVCQEPTQGSETSQYLKEKKSNEMAQVAASERAQSPNRKACLPGLRDLHLASDS